MAIQERVVPRDVTLFTFLAAATRVRKQMAEALDRAGVGVAQYELLERLRAGAWCSVHGIDEKLVEELVVKGWIRRIRNETNGTRVARITPTGRDELRECDIQIEVVRAMFAAAFTAPERAALAHFIGRIP